MQIRPDMMELKTMRNIDPEQLKSQFIGWQCRIRQYAMRKDGGRPSPGMRPLLTLNGSEIGQINVVLVKSESSEITRQFRFMVNKTQDVQTRYDDAIKLLSEYYFQLPGEFDEEMTAVFSLGSEIARKVAGVGECILFFDQGNQSYHLSCKVRLIDPEEDKYHATYWHNHLFNSAMPGSVDVLGFTPDWQNSWFETGGTESQ